MHRTKFVIAPGGMFCVPMGNTYNIRNVSQRDARIFFAQARNMYAPLTPVMHQGETVFSHGDALLAVQGMQPGSSDHVPTAQPAAQPAAQLTPQPPAQPFAQPTAPVRGSNEDEEEGEEEEEDEDQEDQDVDQDEEEDDDDYEDEESVSDVSDTSASDDEYDISRESR